MAMDWCQRPMRSRSLDNADSRARSAQGFTLIELIVVLAVVSLMAGVVTAGLASGSPERRNRATIRHATTLLTTVRLSALGAQRHEACTLRTDAHSLMAMVDDRETRQSRLEGLALDAPRQEITVWFAPDGRASERQVQFKPLESDGPAWTIEFDPLSGTPVARREMKEAHAP